MKMKATLSFFPCLLSLPYANRKSYNFFWMEKESQKQNKENKLG